MIVARRQPCRPLRRPDEPAWFRFFQYLPVIEEEIERPHACVGSDPPVSHQPCLMQPINKRYERVYLGAELAGKFENAWQLGDEWERRAWLCVHGAVDPPV